LPYNFTPENQDFLHGYKEIKEKKLHINISTNFLFYLAIKGETPKILSLH